MLRKCGIAIAIVAVVLAVVYVRGAPTRAKYARAVGMSPREVTRAFGPPRTKYSAENFKATCKALEKEGWIRADDYLPVTDEVWVYPYTSKVSERCLFLYFDKSHKVCRVFHAWW